jgi:peptide/nickel transport system ATP-binding protein
VPSPTAASNVERMAAVLEVQNLRTEFRMRHSSVVAVDDISFTRRSGRVRRVVGESGCGKTTTGLSIMKLLPNVGHVTGGSSRCSAGTWPAGREGDVQGPGERGGMIFQDPLTSLNPP